MYTIDEAIERYTTSAKSCEEYVKEFKGQEWAREEVKRNTKYAEEYHQVANWLSKLKAIYEILDMPENIKKSYKD